MFGKKKAYQPPQIAVPDLMAMQFAELRRIKTEVDAAVAARADEARATIMQQIEDYGLTLDDVKPTKKKRAVKVRYRDSANPENTWTGQGKPKKWLQDYLDQGRTMEEFAIQ